MSITFELPPTTETWLQERAAAQGVNATDYARHLFEEALQRETERERQAQLEKNRRAIAWLHSKVERANAMSDEEKAQAEAEWRDTARSIDENRTSSRKLFPEYSTSETTE